MKRSQPLRADPEKTRAWQDRSRKPLKRTAMKRSAPVKRNGKKPTGRGWGGMPSHPSTGFSSKVRKLVKARSGGWCEARIVGVCDGAAAQIHHRKLRRHGDHRLVNALHVCADCHDCIHLHPAWSYRHGLLVQANRAPESVPVVAGATVDGGA